MQPVLEKAINADVLVIGSPVYDSFPTGMARAFIERLVFPAVNYNDYSKYETAVDEPTRAHIRETRFPQDLQKAYDLGKRLVEKALLIASY